MAAAKKLALKRPKAKSQEAYAPGQRLQRHGGLLGRLHLTPAT